MSFRSIPENTKNALDKINLDYSDLLEEYDFYLAGGTALALQIDHRMSYDLDFFSSKEFDPATLLSRFDKLKIENTETSFGTVKFYYDNCQISFFYYPYILIDDFVLLENYKIKLASIIDIGLMKITAIANRSLKKDFFDLFIISKKLGGLKNLLKKFALKYPESNVYHYQKSLNFYKDADQTPDPNALTDFSWNEVKEYFDLETNHIL